MAEIPHIKMFDKEAIRTLNDLIDLVNLGLSNSNVKGGAGLSAAKFRRAVLEDVVVTTAGKVVKHGLGFKPVHVTFDMRTSGRIYNSQDPDSEALYLIADSGTQKARIIVME